MKGTSVREAELFQLYLWTAEDVFIETIRGKLSILEWLEEERRRIVSDPARRAEIRRSGKLVTLFVNRAPGLQKVHR